MGKQSAVFFFAAKPFAGFCGAAATALALTPPPIAAGWCRVAAGCAPVGLDVRNAETIECFFFTIYYAYAYYYALCVCVRLTYFAPLLRLIFEWTTSMRFFGVLALPKATPMYQSPPAPNYQ